MTSVLSVRDVLHDAQSTFLSATVIGSINDSSIDHEETLEAEMVVKEGKKAFSWSDGEDSSKKKKYYGTMAGNMIGSGKFKEDEAV